MFRKLILTGAALAAFTAPSLAADWYVLKSTTAPEGAMDVCIVVDRTATPGEQQISGPYTSQAEGMQAASSDASCEGMDSSG
jgi:hypothetical protein